jgi:hypothetical protein
MSKHERASQAKSTYSHFWVFKIKICDKKKLKKDLPKEAV